MPPRVIVFTGQTGVNIAGALEKLKACLHARRLTCRVLKIDPQMRLQHLSRFPDDPNRMLIGMGSGLQFLLSYPKDYLRGLWIAALDATLAGLDPSCDVAFLTFHAIAYHTISREFFSPVNVAELGRQLLDRGLRVETVITLIDDVYDVISRLRAPGQLFDLGPLLGADRSLRSWLVAHFELLRLFDWRAQEILASEELARQVGAPHYVLATKHPVEVGDALIATNKVPVYLSHPILEIRRLQQVGNRETARAAIEEIQALSLRLVDSARLVPVMPTTIDELRTATQDGISVPQLTERWPYFVGRALHVPPPADAPANPLDAPGAWETLSSDPAAAAAISTSLTLMNDWIAMQIGARDRKLIEQSKAVIVYRPYFNGALSKGIMAELDHRNSLIAFGVAAEGARRCVVFSPPYDLAQFRVNSLVDALASQTQSATAERWRSGTLQAMSRILLEHPGIMEAFGRGEPPTAAVQEVLEQRFGVVFNEIQNRYGTLGGERQPMWRLEAHRKWQEMTHAAATRDPVREALRPGDVYCERQASVDDVARLAEDTIGLPARDDREGPGRPGRLIASMPLSTRSAANSG